MMSSPRILNNGGMAKQADKPRPQDLVTLGKRLKSWRKAKGWSQEKLAWAAGITHAYFNAIENGKINAGVQTLFRLAQILDVSPAVLFLPVSIARKLEKVPDFKTEISEQRLLSFLEDPKRLELNCDFVVHSMQQGDFEVAEVWLKFLADMHPQHWLVYYTQAKYHLLSSRNSAQAPQPMPDAYSKTHATKVAQPVSHYQPAIPPAFEHALNAIQQARQLANTAEVKHRILQDPDLIALKDAFPVQWQALFM